MKDILQQIQNLKEDFSNVLEGLNKEEKEKRNKEYRTMMGKFRKDAYAEDKDPKYSLDSEHGQKVFDYIKKRLGNLSYDPSSAKREEKLLFRTESLDILQQIQSLKEDFMNLIEVEGLGQPASDVPPSTNKIKKDKKTKNGKVELVSVEDELFPYDGNKREQYRQKIINTINGMIQGTATLEDLLQIVRQKKMPVKEGLDKFEVAMGILEEIINEKNSNTYRKHRAEIEQAEQKRPKKEYEGHLDTVPGIKGSNEYTIRRLSKLKTGDKYNDDSISRATSTIANQSRKALGREYYPENPYRSPFVYGGKYKNLYGNLEQKAYEVKGIGKFTPRNANDRKEFIKTSIENQRKINSGKLEEALQLLEKFTEKDREEAAKKVLPQRKREYLSKYGDVLDAADVYGSEEVSDGNMKDLERARKRYKDAEKKAGVTPKRIGRKFNTKESFDKFEVAMGILEEMINEVSVKDVVQAAQNSVKGREGAEQSSHWCGDNYRKRVANELSSLPKSERNIKQLVNAARNSLKGRRAKWSAAFDNLDNEEGSRGDFARASKRRTHANIIAKLGAPKTDKEKTL